MQTVLGALLSQVVKASVGGTEQLEQDGCFLLTHLILIISVFELLKGEDAVYGATLFGALLHLSTP